MPREIQLKRAYAKVESSDGYRLLVDRLWPRGLSKTSMRIDMWFKDIAPSPHLRRWFGHDPERWKEFRRRYFAELKDRPDQVAQLREILQRPKVTFVYAAKDEVHNHAAALREFVSMTKATRAKKSA